MSPFIRTVKTSSGATAVQIVEKRGGVRQIVAHNDADLAVLMAAAREQLVGLIPSEGVAVVGVAVSG